MTIKRFDARRDEPERLIVKGLQAIGCQVLRIENPDLLILYRGQLWLIEVKSPTGRQTRIQRRLVESGWPIHTVQTLVEAVAVVMGKSPEGVVDPDTLMKGLG
jgi:Holliday junction resolvase